MTYLRQINWSYLQKQNNILLNLRSPFRFPTSSFAGFFFNSLTLPRRTIAEFYRSRISGYSLNRIRESDMKSFALLLFAGLLLRPSSAADDSFGFSRFYYTSLESDELSFYVNKPVSTSFANLVTDAVPSLAHRTISSCSTTIVKFCRCYATYL